MRMRWLKLGEISSVVCDHPSLMMYQGFILVKQRCWISSCYVGNAVHVTVAIIPLC